MQVAFGITTNKYSLPIPSTCPEEICQLMTSNQSIEVFWNFCVILADAEAHYRT
jgi:hypothetical protein